MKTRNSRWSLVPVSAVNFLTYAARGLTFPFINIYLVYVGFSGVQIGIILSISAGVRLLWSPLINMLADRTSRHRQVFYGMVGGNALTTFGLVMAAFSQQLLSAVVVIRQSFDATAGSLLAQLTITQLEQHKRDIYGRIRAWGSFGWAVTTMISGLIFAAGGYAFVFGAAALCSIIALPFSRTLPEQTSTTHDDEKPKRGTAQRTPAFYWLMVIWFLFVIGRTAINAFAYVYFQQALGASNAYIGILASVAAIAEIPSMVIIDRVLRRVPIQITLMLGILGMAGLWFAYTLLTAASPLIILMAIRGTFFTLQTVSMTLLVSRISQDTNAATNQALSQVTIPALAVLITGPIAGWIYDTLGGITLFRLSTLIALAAAALLVILRQRLVEVDETVTL